MLLPFVCYHYHRGTEEPGRRTVRRALGTRERLQRPDMNIGVNDGVNLPHRVAPGRHETLVESRMRAACASSLNGTSMMTVLRVAKAGLTHPFGDERTVQQAFPAGVGTDVADPFLMCDYFSFP